MDDLTKRNIFGPNGRVCGHDCVNENTLMLLSKTTDESCLSHVLSRYLCCICTHECFIIHPDSILFVIGFKVLRDSFRASKYRLSVLQEER